jgi:2-aminoadipate transaminase
MPVVLEEDVKPAQGLLEAQVAFRFARRTLGMRSSAIRELLKLTGRPQMISFAGGLPAPELFPTERIAAATRRVLEERGAEALQYGTTEGHGPLRDLLVRHMRRYGIEAGRENVLITTGSQQALDLVGKLFVDPGDVLVVEEPTYLGALQAFGAYEPRYVGMPVDDQGMRVDDLEAELARGPKLLYVLPNFQNPSGVTLSMSRRRRIVELAARYEVPIVEDDPYGQLRYEGEHLPPLIALDTEHRRAFGHGRLGAGVIYLGTLSKTLAPGLRVGWVVAAAEVIARLAQMKQGADLHTSTFCQLVAYETSRSGFLDRHVRRLRAVYGERRDVMLRALAESFPADARWTRPHGGLFLWVTLPPGMDSRELLRRALDHDVAFVPGDTFFPALGGSRTLRLNFSYCEPARIEEGVRRLGGLLRN